MSILQYVKNIILFLIMQALNFVTAGFLIAISYSQFITIMPLLIVCVILVIVLFSIINAEIYFSKIFSYMPIAVYLLAGILPITLVYLTLALLVYNNYFAFLGEENDLLLIILASLLIIFIISTLKNVKKCKHCGAVGFGVSKIGSKKILGRNKVSGTPSQDVTVYDDDGNRYTGTIGGTGSATFETREITYSCSFCKKVLKRDKIRADENSIIDKLKHIRFYIGSFEESYKEDKK